MRAILSALVLAICTFAIPAQAQDTQPAHNFALIVAADKQDRAILIMVSEPRPNNDRPYRAVVAWEGAPDRYWAMTFAFDCGTRKMDQEGTTARNWQREEIDRSFPVGDMYNDYFSWLMAPVLCDGSYHEQRLPTYTSAVDFLRDVMTSTD